MPHNKYSRIVTQDSTQPAAQAMLHAIGLTEEDFKKPFIGIASTGYEGNPCNMHLNQLSLNIKKSINFKRVKRYWIPLFCQKFFMKIYKRNI